MCSSKYTHPNVFFFYLSVQYGPVTIDLNLNASSWFKGIAINKQDDKEQTKSESEFYLGGISIHCVY